MKVKRKITLSRLTAYQHDFSILVFFLLHFFSLSPTRDGHDLKPHIFLILEIIRKNLIHKKELKMKSSSNAFHLLISLHAELFCRLFASLLNSTKKPKRTTHDRVVNFSLIVV